MPGDLREEAVAHLSACDPWLAELIDQVGPCGLTAPRRFVPFRVLTSSIIYQQLTGKAAATILGRFRALYPGRPFPTPEEVRRTRLLRLRKAGLSQAKSLALVDLAGKVLDGTVPDARTLRRLDDEAVVARLTRVRGVGRWTVEMMLIFALGRPDVLPLGDYGVRKGASRLYRRAEVMGPKELAALGERWRPFRSYASWYLWRAAEMKEAR
jgi:3-methyladenine DNA glycosylase/8-oxoguanine DNA glycosylase